MERKMAEQVISEFKKQNGSQELSILEVMSMTKVMTDGYEVYAIQKGDVTFLACKCENGRIITKVQCW